MKTFKVLFMFVLIVLTMIVSAVGVTPALADDETPPPPATEEAVQPPAAEPVVVENPAAAEEQVAAVEPVAKQEAASEEEEVTVAEALEQLPEDTDMVVLDESGEALPLASQKAAEIVVSADPYFYDTNGTKYSFMPIDGCEGIQNCTESDTPIQAAVDAFGDNSNATGNIFVEAGTYDNEDVWINPKSGNFTNLTGLIGAGSGKTTINGYLNVLRLNNPFILQGFTFNNGSVSFDTVHDVTVSDVVVNNTGDFGNGLEIDETTGDVTIVDSKFTVANLDGSGAALYDVQGDITIEDSEFSSEGRSGLNIENEGQEESSQITLTNVTATGGPDKFGVAVMSMSDVSVNGGTFSGGDGAGFAVTGDVLIEGGEFTSESEGSGIRLMVDGNATIKDANIHDNLTGITNHMVTKTFTLCDNIFFGNGVNVEHQQVPGAFGECSPVVVSNPVSGVYDPSGESAPVLYTVFSQTQTQLPGALGDGNTFASAVNVELTEQGAARENLTFKLVFPIPDGMQAADLAVLFWDGSQWVEVSGGGVVGDSFVIVVSTPGYYVLVSR